MTGTDSGLNQTFRSVVGTGSGLNPTFNSVAGTGSRLNQVLDRGLLARVWSVSVVITVSLGGLDGGLGFGGWTAAWARSGRRLWLGFMPWRGLSSRTGLGPGAGAGLVLRYRLGRGRGLRLGAVARTCRPISAISALLDQITQI